MGLIPDATKAKMKAVHTGAVEQSPVSVVLRRGASTLPAQQIMLAVHAGQPAQRRTESGQVVQVDGEVHGTPEMDVMIGDRFNVGGALFKVVFVRPERSVATIAEVQITGAGGSP